MQGEARKCPAANCDGIVRCRGTEQLVPTSHASLSDEPKPDDISDGATHYQCSKGHRWSVQTAEAN